MLEFLIPYAMIPLRIVLGIFFIMHGYPKIKSPGNTAAFFQKVGIPLPSIAAIIVAITEFCGGIAILLGFGTRITAALLVINMSVAAYVRKEKLKDQLIGGYEYDLTLVVAFITLLLLGAGSISIDQVIGWVIK